MKKRIWLVCIMILMLLVPHFASANSAARNPWEIRIYFENIESGSEITIFLAGEDGAFREEDTRPVPVGRDAGLQFLFRDGDTQFFLICTAPDGTKTRSETAQIVMNGKYVFDVKANTLIDRTDYYNRISNCRSGSMYLLLFAMLLIVPIVVTLLLEWLTALCFQIRPVKYVFAINAITNPAMNIILLILTLMLSGTASYWIVLAMLEVAVFWIEFRFYTMKYKEISRRRLLLFTITANVLSFAVGLAVQYFIM